MFLDIMENLSNLWDKIAPYVSGVTVAGIVSTVFYAILAGMNKGFIQKINIEKYYKQANEDLKNEVKQVSFTQSIEPLVEERLQVYSDLALEQNEEMNKDLNAKLDKTVEIIKIFASYFEDSIAVSDEKKTKLSSALEEYFEIGQVEEIKEVESKVIIEDKKKSTKVTTETTLDR